MIYLRKDVAWSNLTPKQIRLLRLFDDEIVGKILSNRLRNSPFEIPVSKEEAEKAMCKIIENAKTKLDINIVGLNDENDPKNIIGQMAIKVIQ